MSEPESEYRCARCGQEFDRRFPGTSVGERGPMHADCIAAELQQSQERERELRETWLAIADLGSTFAGGRRYNEWVRLGAKMDELCAGATKEQP